MLTAPPRNTTCRSWIVVSLLGRPHGLFLLPPLSLCWTMRTTMNRGPRTGTLCLQLVKCVRGRWTKTNTPIQILFDDGNYSVIVGDYEDDNGRIALRIGERWNGTGDYVGYPNFGGNALWYCAPAFLEVPVLKGVLDELTKKPNQQAPEGQMSAAETATARRKRVQEELSDRGA